MQGWEIGEEDTLTINTPLQLADFNAYESPTAFTPAEPGLHRVRLLAKGRDLRYDEVCESPVESYELTIWPVKTQEPRLRLGDDGL